MMSGRLALVLACVVSVVWCGSAGKCSLGKYSQVFGAGTSFCMPCPAGKYGQVQDSSGACLTCGEGQWQPRYKQSECIVCAAGMVSNTDFKCCVPRDQGGKPFACAAVCAEGQFTPPSESSSSTPKAKADCSACPAGKFGMISAGSAVCKHCANGRSQASSGKSACTACAAGRHSSADGQSCLHTHQSSAVPDESSATAAAAATGGGVTSAPTPRPSPTWHWQSCEPGKYKSDRYFKTTAAERGHWAGFCIQCPAGKFQPNPQQSACRVCPAGQTSSGSSMGALAFTSCGNATAPPTPRPAQQCYCSGHRDSDGEGFFCQYWTASVNTAARSISGRHRWCYSQVRGPLTALLQRCNTPRTTYNLVLLAARLQGLHARRGRRAALLAHVRPDPGPEPGGAAA